jgi:hypothetical protein
MAVKWRGYSNSGPSDQPSYVFVAGSVKGSWLKITGSKELCEATLKLLTGAYAGPYLSDDEAVKAVSPTFRPAPCQCNVLHLEADQASLVEGYKDSGLSVVEILYELRQKLGVQTC